MKNIKFTILLILIFSFTTFAQKGNSKDSLLQQLGNSDDTAKILIYQELCGIELKKNSLEKSLKYANLSLSLAKKLKNLEGEAMAYRKIANVFMRQSNYFNTIENLKKSIKIYEKLKDKDIIARLYNNLAIVYKQEGNFTDALDFAFKSLELKKEVGDSSSIAGALNNVGNLYDEQFQTDKALDYYLKSMKILESLPNKKGIIEVYSNIGDIYLESKQYNKSLNILNKGLQYQKNAKEASIIYKTLGKVYYEMEKWDSSLLYLNKAFYIIDDGDNKNRKAEIYNSLAKTYLKKGQTSKALSKAWISLKFAKEIKSKLSIKEVSETLKDIYEKFGNYKEAYDYQELFISYKDSIYTDDTKKQMSQLEKSSQIQNLKSQKLIQDKENKVLKEREKTQNLITIGIVFILITVGFFAYMIYKSKEKMKKANVLLEEQKKEIQIKNKNIQEVNDLLVEKHEEILTQKNEIQKKNTEITKKNDDIESSIRYASRIQAAILPQKNKIKKLLPESFILFKPRDIVSGDFYWLSENDGKIIITAVDCTGHGVPGAFMSMISSTILNEIVNQKNIVNSASILENLHTGVNTSLKQKETANQDGMDMALCTIDKENKVCYFSGAKNPLVYIQNGELKQLKGDKMPIGGMLSERKNHKPFASYEIPLKEDNTFYLFSDGYQDQFGGPKGRKFMRKRFKELLFEIHQKPMEEQKLILDKEIELWKGKLEQIDDILVIGFKV